MRLGQPTATPNHASAPKPLDAHRAAHALAVTAVVGSLIGRALDGPLLPTVWAAEDVRERRRHPSARLPRLRTGLEGVGTSVENCEALGSLMQEVGKQLFHDLGLVDGDEVISVVNDLDACVGQLLAETGCHLRPIVEPFIAADDDEHRWDGGVGTPGTTTSARASVRSYDRFLDRRGSFTHDNALALWGDEMFADTVIAAR
jgi:hypothetical protein